MAVVVTLEFPGMSQEQFQSVAQQAGTATQLSAGQLFRAAGPIAGGWQVVACFDSIEVFRTYFQERLLTADCANVPGTWTATFDGPDGDEAMTGFTVTAQNEAWLSLQW